MYAATRPSWVPVVRLAAFALGATVLYLLLTVVLGVGSSHAHAAEGDDRDGLLSGVTNVVGDTLSRVTGQVPDSTQALAGAVGSVIHAAPEPVRAVVAPVTPAVAAVVDAIVTPVAQVAESHAVSAVVTPAVTVVTAVPVVGTVVSGVGLDGALTDVAITTDEAVTGLVGTVDHTVAEVGAVAGPVPGTPSAGTPTAPGGLPGSAPTTAGLALSILPSACLFALGGDTTAGSARALAALQALWQSSTPLGEPLSSAIVTAGPGAAETVGGSILSAALPLGVCAPGGISSTGSSGAGPGAMALAVLAPLAAHRAWVLRRGRGDDELPPAPFFGTDVSPD